MAHPALPLTVQPCYKMVVQGSLFDQTTLNTLYYMDTAPGATNMGNGEMEQMAADVWTVIDGPWLACVAADWSLVRITFENLNDPTIRPGILDYTPGAIVGTHAGDADTAWVAGKITRITPVNGLRGQGCIRISGIATSEIAGNQMSGALKTLFTTLGTTLMTPVTNTANPAVTVRFAQVHRTPGLAPVLRGAVVNETNASSYLSSQRTRKTRLIV